MATGFDDFSVSGHWTQDRDATNTSWTFASGSLTTGGGNGVEGLTLNAVDSDANRDNADELVKIHVTSALTSTPQFVAFARGTTGGSGPNRYAARMGGGFFRTYKFVNSTSATQLSTVTTTNFDAIGDYWVRFRVNSTTVQARIWKDGTSEPGTWNTNATDNAGVSGTDSSVTGTGWVGVMASNASTGNKSWINGFGWGTNGDTAPASGSSNTAVTPDVGSAFLTGYAPTLAQTANQSLVPDAGTLTFTGYAPSIAQPVSVTPDVGTLTLTGFAPTLAQTVNQEVTPNVGSFPLTGYAPTVAQTANQAILPDVGALAITGYAPTVVQLAGGSINPDAGAITFTGYAPTLSQTANREVLPNQGQVVITGYPPLVGQPHTELPDTGALALTGYAPTIAQLSNVYAFPGVGGLSIVGYAPTVVRTFPAAGPRYRIEVPFRSYRAEVPFRSYKKAA